MMYMIDLFCCMVCRIAHLVVMESPKLLLHGMQKPGTASGAAMQRMRDEEIKFSYSRLKP